MQELLMLHFTFSESYGIIYPLEQERKAVMPKISSRSPEERIPFYYEYFGKKKDKNISRIKSEEIREELGFKSASSINRDLQMIIENPGRRSYGYNVNYIYNTLQKMLGMDVAKHAYVYGPVYSFMQNPELVRRNIVIHGDAEPETVDLLIITDENLKDLAPIIERHPEITNIYNFTSNLYDTELPVTDFDFLQMILDAIGSEINKERQ